MRNVTLLLLGAALLCGCQSPQDPAEPAEPARKAVGTTGQPVGAAIETLGIT